MKAPIVSTVLVVAIVGLCNILDSDVDPRFREEVQEFEERYDTEINFPVKMVSHRKLILMHSGSSPDRLVGICKKSLLNRRVLFSKKQLEKYNVSMEQIVFHELGHCKFDLQHDHSTLLGRGIPPSIMWPNLMSPATYNKNKKYYRQELADKIKEKR